MICNLATEYYNKEKKKIAFAHTEFEKAKFYYRIEQMKYNDTVRNYNWRDWVYIDYNSYIKEILNGKQIKEPDYSGYSDKEVFRVMLSLSEEEYTNFSIDKEVISRIKPKTIEDVATVFALGKSNTSYGDILHEDFFSEKIYSFPEGINKVLVKTNNTILYDNQIIQILNELLGAINIARKVNTLFNKLRYCTSTRKILREIKSPDITAERFISKLTSATLRQPMKIGYLTIKSRLEELGYDEADRLFFILIKGTILSCRKSDARAKATYFYRYCNILKTV